ncbi:MULTISPECIES: SAM-dependent methyltransferase [Bacillus]|uniref:SAM-dependent methyltransferase n=1 Tax=Bacillus TaxID=1386 RepID=UPI00215A7673|nr:SAM-dependent methyltransferase [Bacillus pseudomycoides]MCR8859154.1 SAM-dependent methyltransferase [Bacillus pseudomycoides]
MIDQKARGGYYTPEEICNFLVKWAVSKGDEEILEPSCGDGNFLVAAAQQLLNLNTNPQDISRQLYAHELIVEEADKAKDRLSQLNISDVDSIIQAGDFFTNISVPNINNKKFDVVIGNPPFIRYQDFPEEHRDIAFQIMNSLGYNPNRLTNIWVTFLVISSHLLKSDGKLAMVIPAELFQVGYAAETRKFLSEYFEKITIITFKKLVFEGIQQEVVLLMCERKANDPGIRTIELTDVPALMEIEPGDLNDLEIKPIDHDNEKWTKYFLETREILLLRKLKNNPLIKLSNNYIDVNVGVVTGQNKFFILTKEMVDEHNLNEYTEPIVSKSAQLKGCSYSLEDWNSNNELQLPTNIFVPPNVDFEDLPNECKSYIQLGEENGVNKGYKCRIRKKWYIVPSMQVPQGFMLRQVYGYPKLILNDFGGTSTDTVHRVNFVNGTNPEQTVCAFLNSLTFAFSEVTGRSYGGGVLTFEPSEAEKLPLPMIGAERLDMAQIDNLLREGNIEEVLNITDQVLLVEGLGLTQEEVSTIREIWTKLRDRRINRK